MNSENAPAPFIRFEIEDAGMDWAETEKQGKAVKKTRIVCYVLPHGSKGDGPAFVWEEFIARKKREAFEGKYDMRHVERFEAEYKAWQEHVELPREGSPVLLWEEVTNDIRKQCIAAGYKTIEDIAAIPDSGLSILGLNGRYIRDSAKAKLRAMSSDLAPLAKENADLKAQVAEMSETIKRFEARMSAVEGKETLSLKKKVA
jgi:predicted nuclease with TOPRIM domain